MDNIGLPALLGVIVGASIAYLYNISLEQRKAQRERVNLAKLLLADIDTLWDRYYQVLGKIIEQHEDLEEPPLLSFPANQNYFVIFDSNAIKIGMFEPKIAGKIVKLYIFAKAYLDSIRGYEELSNNYRKWSNSYEISDEIAAAIVNLRQITLDLKNTLSMIKKEHIALKELVDEVRKLLENISKNKQGGLKCPNLNKQ